MQRTPFGQKLDQVKYYDWISIRKILIVISFLIFGLLILFNLGYIGMFWSTRHMDGTTLGRITNRIDQSGIVVSKYGNRDEIFSTKYEYEYNVQGNIYYNTCYLTYSLWNSKKLKMIRTGSLPIKVEVKYDKKHPYDSVIWIP